MAVDPSIYSQVQSYQAPNPLADLAQIQQLQQLKNQNQLAQFTMQDRQQGQQDQQAIRNSLLGATNDADRIQRLRSTGLPAGFTAADSLEQSITKRRASDATAAKTEFETSDAQYKAGVQRTLSLTDPTHAATDIDSAVANKKLDPSVGELLKRSLPTDPAGFSDWKLKVIAGLNDPQHFAELLKPTVALPNAGGQIVPTQTNPLAGPVGPLAGATPIKVTQSPDSIASNKTSLATAGIAAATSRANNAATIAKDYKVAGLDNQGNFTGGTDGAGALAGLVDAIGTGKVPESTALGRVPPGLKAQVLQQVMTKYPDYDPSTVAAKAKAARDFGTGNQGNAMRSFAVAGNHLDQLGSLVDALDNGNTPLINKYSNIIATNTGSTAPTNFDAAKDVVGKEVVKAIVAGGGGVAERQELSNQLSNAKTPAQLKGVIGQYRNLMSAQHEALLQQRRAAGLPDSTLPNYKVDAGAAPAASGWTVTPVSK